ncbi:MAG TPA: sigma 54-interacting transcriptional regulator [bacterium]|nr:sigma 54-interacting transcriptional regulator [bacterium]
MYLLLYRDSRHLFSFYINSAKKKVVIGGDEGDILFPPDMRGYELTLRREFDFRSRQYAWVLYPSSKGFTLNGKEARPGDHFSDSDVVAIRDFSFSFSQFSHLATAGEGSETAKGRTVVVDTERTAYKSILVEHDGRSKSFLFRDGREIVVGRKKTDISLLQPDVSAEHLVISMKEAGIFFWNKGKNGTYINGMRVENGELQEGKYRFLIAGKHPVTVTVLRERVAESFHKGSLEPLFEKVEGWFQRPELFDGRPIILFSGESGVGKEVFAEFTHAMSGRKGEFVTYNAAAIPETLAESELFGTCKGSFTGAEDRAGAFLQADGGTLFLDEIAEMPLSLQGKMLRVLEDWTVRRVGESSGGKKVDLLMILATNRDLAKEIAAGRFRKDLFYRISTLAVTIPPLRDRRADILPLARHLLFSLTGREVSFTPGAITALESHDWPGNVRELKSVMTRFAYTGKDPFDASDVSA